MPPASLTAMIAGVIFLSAATALLLGLHINETVDLLVTYAGVGFCAVYGLRGIIGFLPFWRRKMSLEPFSTLNKIIYSPACVLIAEGFFSLITPRF